VGTEASGDAEGMLVDVSPETLRRHLRGGTLTSARRHGKHLFLEVDGRDRWLWLHFGMTGEARPYEADEDEPAYTRLRLDFEDGQHLAFTSRRRLGRIGLVESPDRFVEERDLGPDPWNDPPDREAFLSLTRGRPRAGIKSALMNQKVMSGLGNIYVDEILFQAGVHPESAVGDLDDETLEKVRRSLRAVLERAIEAEADPRRMPRTWLLPNRDEGADCPRCRGTIVKSQVAGRSTYRCDAHQPRVP
jgi:formamidopyrimidine-DNA glycosylase